MNDRLASAYLRHVDRAVIVVDRQGRIGFANPAAGRLFLAEPDDLVGCSLTSWIEGCEDLLGFPPKGSNTEMGQRLASPEPFIRQGHRADGTDVTFAIRAIPLKEACSFPRALELEVQDGPLTKAVKDQRLLEIIERTPNPVGMADPQGRVLYLNPGFRAFVCKEPDEPLSFRHIGEFHPPWALTKLQEEGLPRAQAEGVWEGEVAIWNAVGEEVPVLQTVHAHYHPDGSVAFYSTLFQDISDLRNREAKLQGFYQILDSLGAYVFCKDEHLRYTYVNAHAVALLGYPFEEIIGRTDEDLFGESAQRMVEEGDRVVLDEGRAVSQEERLYVASQGEYRNFLAVKKPLRDGQGRIRGLYGISTDITGQKELEGKLTHQASHDFLTQVLNRSAAESLLEQHMKLAKRYGTPVSVILADVDRFKTVNDRLGHEAGDRVLFQLTATLGAYLRETDILTRWGGEEFLVVVPETERDETCELAERLRIEVEKQVGQEIPPGTGTISAGVAQYQPGESLQSWVHRADRALYEAKEAGRNRIVWSD